MKDLTNEINAVRDGMKAISEGYCLMTQEIITLKSELHDCANELCYRCGQYKNEHLGACNGCRWLDTRKGKFE